MSDLKTFLLGLFGGLWILSAASPSLARTLEFDDPLYRFATCTGRLSAVMEFQWLTDGPASESTERERATMIDLIDAIIPANAGPQVLSWRINAKIAQSGLLTNAYFGTDPERAIWSAEIAQERIDECRALLLS